MTDDTPTNRIKIHAETTDGLTHKVYSVEVESVKMDVPKLKKEAQEILRGLKE